MILHALHPLPMAGSHPFPQAGTSLIYFSFIGQGFKAGGALCDFGEGFPLPLPGGVKPQLSPQLSPSAAANPVQLPLRSGGNRLKSLNPKS